MGINKILSLQATIHSDRGFPLKLRYKSHCVEMDTEEGRTYMFNGNLEID